MSTLLKPNNLTVPSSLRESVSRYEGRHLDERKSVEILWKHGIKFSAVKGRARKESPLIYLRAKGDRVPNHLRNVVLTKDTQPGNKLWGRIDFLVNHCGYRLIDER